MIPAPRPADDEMRLQALRALGLIDTAPEERFDRVTRLATRLFDVPVALVCLVDAERQWFKSKRGIEIDHLPRDVSFCGHTVLESDLMVVPDALEDERFHDNPLVTGERGLRFYAGYPIASANGQRVGTFCILDYQPRSFGEEDLQLLRDLGKMVEEQFTAMRLMTIDDLTGLSNRRGFKKAAGHALALCRRLDRPASLLYIDLDGFKQINDEHGHATGDRALVEFAEILLHSFRDSDLIARLGGDEFCVLLSGASAEQTDGPMSKLDHVIAERNARGGKPYGLACSVGAVAFDPMRHETIDQLLADADRRMYERKRESQARVAPGEARAKPPA